AVDASPSIRALEAEIDAAREAVRSAGALPNPMAMAGVQNLHDDLSNDEMMTMYMVGASQAFVPGARRESLERAGDATARALEANRKTLEAEVRRDAVAAWIGIASIDERREVVRTVLTVTDAMIASSRARYESGSAIQADILRAQLVRSDLQHEVLSLDGERLIAEASLRSLLGLEASAEIPTLHLQHEEPAPPAGPIVSDAHAAIAALEAEVERWSAEIDLAKSATRPDWSVEASYGYRPETNGMITVLGKVELPVRREKTIEPRIREAIARREAALRRLEELRRSLAEQAAIAGAVLDQSVKQLKFHHEVLVPQAKLAFDATLAAYQTARADFEALLGSESAYVRLATDYYEFLERALRGRADLAALQEGARTIRVGAAAVSASGAASATNGGAQTSSMSSM
ncbi:MAG TPA: TolC family protein, partial [Thermoanaerobaculia bacterium]